MKSQFQFVERSRTMKAPVGLLSGRTVLRSKMEGLCPDKFTFVEVIKGCIMEIEYKQKISRPMNCRNCFYPFTGNPAIIPKNLSVRCTIPHELFLRGMVISWSGWFARLMMEKQSHFCIIFWWTLLIRDSTLEMSWWNGSWVSIKIFCMWKLCRLILKRSHFMSDMAFNNMIITLQWCGSTFCELVWWIDLQLARKP